MATGNPASTTDTAYMDTLADLAIDASRISDKTSSEKKVVPLKSTLPLPATSLSANTKGIDKSAVSKAATKASTVVPGKQANRTDTTECAPNVYEYLQLSEKEYMEASKCHFKQMEAFLIKFSGTYKCIPGDDRVITWPCNISTIINPKLMIDLACQLTKLYRVTHVTITPYTDRFTIFFGKNIDIAINEAEEHLAKLRNVKRKYDSLDGNPSEKRPRGKE